VVRAAWGGDIDPARAVWSKLQEQAVLSLAVPEELGGMGMSALDLVGILQETGRCALPGPIVETTLVAPLSLAALPGLENILQEVADGAVIAVGREGTPVAHATWADHLLLVGDVVRLASRSAVRLEPVRSVDRTRGLAHVSVDDSRCLTLPPTTTDRIEDLSALGAAAQLLGLATWMLDTAVAYAKVREQFRRPIGSFQAVQHHLADARVALHVAEPLVHRAAHSVTHGHSNASLHISMAKAQASDAAQIAARKALQVHGAIGYSTEHDLHLWMKRTWALARAWGDAPHHRERVASALLDAPQDLAEPLCEGIHP
jgi:alkylation response protein AidB-like acyl-CoA dehydrogenase